MRLVREPGPRRDLCVGHPGTRQVERAHQSEHPGQGLGAITERVQTEPVQLTFAERDGPGDLAYGTPTPERRNNGPDPPVLRAPFPEPGPGRLLQETANTAGAPTSPAAASRSVSSRTGPAGHRSANGTRRSRSSLAGTPKTAGPWPGAKRSPTKGVPGGTPSTDCGPVSGPATSSRPPLQIRSVHPSGSTGRADGCMVRAHSTAPPTREARSRYPPDTPGGPFMSRVSPTCPSLAREPHGRPRR